MNTFTQKGKEGRSLGGRVSGEGGPVRARVFACARVPAHVRVCVCVCVCVSVCECVCVCFVRFNCFKEGHIKSNVENLFCPLMVCLLRVSLENFEWHCRFISNCRVAGRMCIERDGCTDGRTKIPMDGQWNQLT